MARGNGHLEWESSKDERYAEKWWTDHGFSWTLKKRFVSKSVYEISKDGVKMNYEIPNVGNMNMKDFMEGHAGFVKHWQTNIEYQKLLQEAKEAGIR